MMGVINSPKLYSLKKSGRVPKYLPQLIEESVKGIPLRKRHTQQKLVKLMVVSKTTVHHWIVELTLRVHSNSLRPILTEENRLAQFEMAMDVCDPVDQMRYQDMRDQIHVDEKWFFLTREKERYLLHWDKKTLSIVSNTKCILLRKCSCVLLQGLALTLVPIIGGTVS